MQSRKLSLIETFVGIFIGWCVSIWLNANVFPLFGINIPMETNLKVSVIFTIAAILRSYALRRFFNWIAIRELLKNNKASNATKQNLQSEVLPIEER
jgi:hypothetical protein